MKTTANGNVQKGQQKSQIRDSKRRAAYKHEQALEAGSEGCRDLVESGVTSDSHGGQGGSSRVASCNIGERWTMKESHGELPITERASSSIGLGQKLVKPPKHSASLASILGSVARHGRANGNTKKFRLNQEQPRRPEPARRSGRQRVLKIFSDAFLTDDIEVFETKGGVQLHSLEDLSKDENGGGSCTREGLAAEVDGEDVLGEHIKGRKRVPEASRSHASLPRKRKKETRIGETSQQEIRQWEDVSEQPFGTLASCRNRVSNGRQRVKEINNIFQQKDSILDAGLCRSPSTKTGGGGAHLGGPIESTDDESDGGGWLGSNPPGWTEGKAGTSKPGRKKGPKRRKRRKVASLEEMMRREDTGPQRKKARVVSLEEMMRKVDAETQRKTGEDVGRTGGRVAECGSGWGNTTRLLEGMDSNLHGSKVEAPSLLAEQEEGSTKSLEEVVFGPFISEARYQPIFTSCVEVEIVLARIRAVTYRPDLEVTPVKVKDVKEREMELHADATAEVVFVLPDCGFAEESKGGAVGKFEKNSIERVQDESEGLCICAVCRRPGERSMIVGCWKCGRVEHLTCGEKPPLSSSVEKWSCQECRECNSCNVNVLTSCNKDPAQNQSPCHSCSVARVHNDEAGDKSTAEAFTSVGERGVEAFSSQDAGVPGNDQLSPICPLHRTEYVFDGKVRYLLLQEEGPGICNCQVLHFSEYEVSCPKACAACGGPQNSQEEEIGFITCMKCGKGYHDSCVGICLRVTPQLKDRWRCSSCKLCETCGEIGAVRGMIICGVCDKGFHKPCLPEDCLPTTNNRRLGWACPHCSSCKCGACYGEAAALTRWYPVEGEVVCGRCWLRREKCEERGEMTASCQICRAPFTVQGLDGGLPVVQCSICEGLLHVPCMETVEGTGGVGEEITCLKGPCCLRCRAEFAGNGTSARQGGGENEKPTEDAERNMAIFEAEMKHEDDGLEAALESFQEGEPPVLTVESSGTVDMCMKETCFTEGTEMEATKLADTDKGEEVVQYLQKIVTDDKRHGEPASRSSAFLMVGDVVRKDGDSRERQEPKAQEILCNANLSDDPTPLLHYVSESSHTVVEIPCNPTQVSRLDPSMVFGMQTSQTGWADSSTESFLQNSPFQEKEANVWKNSDFDSLCEGDDQRGRFRQGSREAVDGPLFGEEVERSVAVEVHVWKSKSIASSAVEKSPPSQVSGETQLVNPIPNLSEIGSATNSLHCSVGIGTTSLPFPAQLDIQQTKAFDAGSISAMLAHSPIHSSVDQMNGFSEHAQKSTAGVVVTSPLPASARSNLLPGLQKVDEVREEGGVFETHLPDKRISCSPNSSSPRTIERLNPAFKVWGLPIQSGAGHPPEFSRANRSGVHPLTSNITNNESSQNIQNPFLQYPHEGLPPCNDSPRISSGVFNAESLASEGMRQRIDSSTHLRHDVGHVVGVGSVDNGWKKMGAVVGRREGEVSKQTYSCATAGAQNKEERTAILEEKVTSLKANVSELREQLQQQEARDWQWLQAAVQCSQTLTEGLNERNLLFGNVCLGQNVGLQVIEIQLAARQAQRQQQWQLVKQAEAEITKQELILKVLKTDQPHSTTKDLQSSVGNRQLQESFLPVRSGDQSQSQQGEAAKHQKVQAHVGQMHPQLQANNLQVGHGQERSLQAVLPIPKVGIQNNAAVQMAERQFYDWPQLLPKVQNCTPHLVHSGTLQQEQQSELQMQHRNTQQGQQLPLHLLQFCEQQQFPEQNSLPPSLVMQQQRQSHSLYHHHQQQSVQALYQQQQQQLPVQALHQSQQQQVGLQQCTQQQQEELVPHHLNKQQVELPAHLLQQQQQSLLYEHLEQQRLARFMQQQAVAGKLKQLQEQRAHELNKLQTEVQSQKSREYFQNSQGLSLLQKQSSASPQIGLERMASSPYNVPFSHGISLNPSLLASPQAPPQHASTNDGSMGHTSFVNPMKGPSPNRLESNHWRRYSTVTAQHPPIQQHGTSRRRSLPIKDWFKVFAKTQSLSCCEGETDQNQISEQTSLSLSGVRLGNDVPPNLWWKRLQNSKGNDSVDLSEGEGKSDSKEENCGLSACIPIKCVAYTFRKNGVLKLARVPVCGLSVPDVLGPMSRFAELSGREDDPLALLKECRAMLIAMATMDVKVNAGRLTRAPQIDRSVCHCKLQGCALCSTITWIRLVSPQSKVEQPKSGSQILPEGALQIFAEISTPKVVVPEWLQKLALDSAEVARQKGREQQGEERGELQVVVGGGRESASIEVDQAGESGAILLSSSRSINGPNFSDQGLGMEGQTAGSFDCRESVVSGGAKQVEFLNGIFMAQLKKLKCPPG